VPEEEIESSTTEEKGWLGKIKDSTYQNWQTILVALIVLIVGISAYNYNQKTGTSSPETANQTENADQTTAAKTADQEQAAEENDQVAAEQAKTEAVTPPTTDTTQQPTQETKTPETNTNTTNTTESNGEDYKVVAEKGDGITRLARKALEKYLSENSDSEVTALHKIYIEDYLQNRIGSQEIGIGHTENISKASIQEAIVASKKLSQNSLNNLKKYSK
jgi:hypothetical protein